MLLTNRVHQRERVLSPGSDPLGQRQARVIQHFLEEALQSAWATRAGRSAQEAGKGMMSQIPGGLSGAFEYLFQGDPFTRLFIDF